MTTYKVQVTREGKWWMVTIPALNGLTQARRLSEAGNMAREFIAVSLDLPVDDVAVEVTVGRIGSVSGIRETLEQVRDERKRAAELELGASRTVVALAKRLAAENVPLRDIGVILEVSYQRAHQLVSS